MKNSFRSDLRKLGTTEFPSYSDLRIMMMPIRLDDLAASLPVGVLQYFSALQKMLKLGPRCDGVGYLTIDEAVVKQGECHRRPGLHVDGMGGWAGPSPWASKGMIIAASVMGCCGWDQTFEGEPSADGCCEHLRSQCRTGDRYSLSAGEVWLCSPMVVHESAPMPFTQRRQFVRISMPSDAPWYEGYTANPLGVKPTGPILPRRAAQMSYRP